MKKEKVFIDELPQEVKCPFCQQMIDINLIQRSKGQIDEIEVYFPCPHYWKIVAEGARYSVVFLFESYKEKEVKCERVRSIAEFD